MTTLYAKLTQYLSSILQKPTKKENIPPGSFVLKGNFANVHFSDNVKPLRIGPYKLLDRFTDETFELFSQDGSTFHSHRNQLLPCYPKEPILYPQLSNFMRFSDSIQNYIPESIKFANYESSPFNSDDT